jgi:hypothetical protein
VPVAAHRLAILAGVVTPHAPCSEPVVKDRRRTGGCGHGGLCHHPAWRVVCVPGLPVHQRSPRVADVGRCVAILVVDVDEEKAHQSAFEGSEHNGGVVNKMGREQKCGLVKRLNR